MPTPTPDDPTPRPGLRTLLRQSFVLLVSICTGWLAATTYGDTWQLPDRDNPWAPLAIRETPGWTTRYKLGRLENDPPACLAALRGSAARFEPLHDREAGPGCGLRDTVRITSIGASVSQPFTLTCPAAVALMMWERHSVAPEALRVFGSPLRRIDHFGSFACRNVYGRATGPRSQHATANAFDVAGFVLQNGRRITVARDWRGEGPDADFLHRIHAGACGYFSAVFGPDYNAAHADHFHLDRGPYRSCR